MKIDKKIIAISITIGIIISIGVYFAIKKYVPTNVTTTVLAEGQREGPFLVHKIYPDRVEGSVFVYAITGYDEYKVNITVGSSVGGNNVGFHCVGLKLIKIEGDAAIFKKRERSNCPVAICLSGTTFVETPNGPINIKELKKGDEIWTVDLSGTRKAGVILETARSKVSKDHKMAHLVLDDGRELFASQNHPTADGRKIGEISVGDFLDGSTVISFEMVHYKETYTYDILPSGETGFYWANNILIKSTLK
ncbi:hypothetical protein HYY71_00130 [Candidatus Woesearchaeota archaeon]|nr:hypothetical protein [Candidatus Woesearchaeota archaeon]